MKSISDGSGIVRRRLLGAALALPTLGLGTAAGAAHPHAAMALHDFDATVWAQLLARGPRPAAYVFTTTYCSTCPAVFELLDDTLRAAGRQVELAAVVMDAQGPRALAHAHHYRGATRFYAFNGFEPEIRRAVDPKWRNITPYVVLLGRDGADQRRIGPPDAATLRRWLG